VNLKIKPKNGSSLLRLMKGSPMPRHWLLFGLLVTWMILLVSPASISTAQTERDADDFTRQVDQDMPGLLRSYDVPGTTLALIENGEVVWTRGNGMADVATGRPVTNNTVFQAASISKAVSAWGVMRLVEQGKLELDAPAERYLTRWHFPPSRFDARGVTIRRLLSHTAGLSAGLSTGYGGFEPGEPLPTLEESLAGKTTVKGGVRIVSAPGSGFRYSGANYIVLQLLVEEVTGLPFSTYMHQEVLEPLGMTHSSYTWTPEVRSATARPYDAWGQPLPNYIIPERAAGGLYTTAPDLARFVAAHTGGPQGQAAGRGVLAPETLRQMLTPQPATKGAPFGDRWGLGYQLTDAGSAKLAQHSGDNIGWKTWAVFHPDAGTGLVVLTNSDRGANLSVELTRRWLHWAGAGDDTGIWQLYQRIDVGLKSVAGLLGSLAVLYGWRLVAQLRSGRRQPGWSSLRSPTWRKVARVLLLAVVPLAVTVGWWVLVYRLPLAGGFAVKYPYSAVLPLSLRYVTASLAVCSLALVATAFAPRAPSAAPNRRIVRGAPRGREMRRGPPLWGKHP
jgi:CubicO group peptidase (beta-lactamase class C family)